MACQIQYNDNGTYEVSAPNGKSSILYQQILALPEMEDDYSALQSWTKVYTKSFKEWFGKDWENISDKERDHLIKDGYLDNNGEPTIFFRGDYTGIESFNYSDAVGKFGQGIYIAQNKTQAESFAKKTGKKVYPVFVKPTKSVKFKNVVAFQSAAAKFNDIKTVPTEQHIKNYVESLHDDGKVIIGSGVMGKEYNVPNKDTVKSIFGQGLEITRGLLFDNVSPQKLLTEEFQKKRKSDQFVNELISRLTTNLGMSTEEVKTVSKAEAAVITANAKNPWTNQPAFFFEGKVYFVEGQINYDTAFHEFSHVLIRAMSKENPALFERIYTDIIADSKGKDFLSEALLEYPDLAPDHTQVKEEVIVKAMSHVAETEKLLDPNAKASSGLSAAIKKLIYAFKQLFRKLSKKADVKTLSPNTTVKDLTGMLLDETWDLNMDVVSDSDVAAYLSDLKTIKDELMSNKSSKTRLAMYEQLEENSRITRRQLSEMMRNENVEDLKIALVNNMGRLAFDQMIENASKTLSTKQTILNATGRVIDELHDFEDQIEALALNLNEIDQTVTNMSDDIKSLVKEPDQKKALRTLSYYVDSMKEWDLYLDRFKDRALESGLESGSAIVTDINKIRTDIENTQDNIKTIYKSTLSGVFTEIFGETNRNILKAKDAQIAKHQQKLNKATPGGREAIYLQGLIDDLVKEKEDLVVTREKMEDYLTGKMGDIGFMHAYFENFISNQDPSIASFAAFVKKGLSTTQTKVHNKYNEFVTKLEPLIKELGISPSDLKKFSRKTVFTDKTYRQDTEGNVIEYEAYTFLNEYQNYKFSLAKLNELEKDAKSVYLAQPSEENLQKLDDAYALKEDHITYFFKKEFVDDYYLLDEALNSTELGRKAKGEIDNVLEDIKVYQATHPNSSEIYEDLETVEVLWRDYKQHFSLYDEFGAKKTGEDLEKAELLREWRDSKRDFHRYDIIPGAFEGSLKNLEVKLIAKLQETYEHDTPEFKEEFKRQRQSWIDRNIHIEIKDEFYVARNNISNRIKEIMSTIKEDTGMDEEFQVILDSLQGRKDNDGQPVATEMTEEHIKVIRDIQVKIEAVKRNSIGISGLTPNEMEEMSFLIDKLATDQPLTPEQIARYKELKSKKSKQGLSKIHKEELFSLFDALDKMQVRLPTDYYTQIVNEHYSAIKREENPDEIPADLNPEDMEQFLNPAYVERLFAKNSDFERWFKANHILKKKFNKELGVIEEVYERIYAWSTVRPKSEKHFKSTDIFDEDGQFLETLLGVPNIKFQKRSVKDEFKTGYNAATKVVDEEAHKDYQGNSEPKSLEEMKVIKDKYGDKLDKHNKKIEEALGHKISWDHYINHKYLDMKAANSPEYRVLELLKEFHIEGQKGLERQATLGLELPRFRKDLYQYITSGTPDNSIGGKMRELGKGLMAWRGKKKDDLEEGLNFDQEMSYVNVDVYTKERSKAPIRGKYLLDLDQTSEDVVQSMFMYFQSAEQNKTLRDMQPIANAMKELAQDNPVDLGKINKQVWLTRNAKEYIKGDKNLRKSVIEGMIEMTFEGKRLTSGSNQATYVKAVNGMLGLASHSFFAFDITSAMKNFLGAQWQISIEGVGGRYYKYKNWQRGRPWAMSTMWQISNQVYKTGAKTLDVQIVEVFDAIQGRFQDKFGESPSRSKRRDIANLTWTTSHRKWLETEATLQLFSAIMHDTKIDQVQPDGSTKKIQYKDAWEIDEATGKIQLKEGIDKTWDMGGEKFDEIKFKNHEVSNLLQGAYAEFDQPLVSRFLLFRFVSSMRKYFTKMMLHRYGAAGSSLLKPKTWFHGKERYNLGTNNTHLGFYMQNLSTFRKVLQSKGMHAMHMSQPERRALRMGMFDLMKLQLLIFSYFWLFGFDPDDPDKWKKLKKKSGALPTPVTDEDWSKGFDLGGWTENHMLLLMMHVEAENEHFIPFPGKGLDDLYSVTFGETSVSAKASLGSIKGLATSLWNTIGGYDKAYYKKDVGALIYQQEGENKGWKQLAKMFGLKGKFIDPVTSVKNFYGSRENPR